MPHLIIECSESVLSQQSAQALVEAVHTAAVSTGLFAEANIQVRVQPFSAYSVGGKSEDFISVFANILEGRTAEQKTQLAKAVVVALVELCPQVPHVELNVNDLLKGTGFNRKAL